MRIWNSVPPALRSRPARDAFAPTLRSAALVDQDSFRQPAHYDFYYRQHDIRDRIWVVSPVNTDTEYLCFDRMGDRPAFDADDPELAAFALRGIK